MLRPACRRSPGPATPVITPREAVQLVKFTVERDILTDAVSWAARSLSPRPPVPVLSGLLITAEAGVVSIASFDYETSARLEIEADVETAGQVLVSGRLLNDIVRSLPQAQVTVELDGGKVLVTCRSSRFSLATMPVGDYPALPELPAPAGTVDGAAFARTGAPRLMATRLDRPGRISSSRATARDPRCTRPAIRARSRPKRTSCASELTRWDCWAPR